MAAIEEVTCCGSEIVDSGNFTIRYSGSKEQSLIETGYIIN
jgi:hypothetical protein